MYFRISRKCYHEEECADIAIDRLAKRISEGEDIANIDKYVHKIASYVLKEYERKFKQVPSLETPEDINKLIETTSIDVFNDKKAHITEKNKLKCIDSCLDKLAANDRIFIVKYYRFSGTKKIKNRKELAKEMGISSRQMIKKASIIRNKRIRPCAEECFKKIAH